MGIYARAQTYPQPFYHILTYPHPRPHSWRIRVFSQALLRLCYHTNSLNFFKWTCLSEITCWISNKGHFTVFKARAISWISLKRMKVKSWTVYGFDNQIISLIKTEQCALESHLHDKKHHLFGGHSSPLTQDIRKRKKKCLFSKWLLISSDRLKNNS